MASDNPSPLSRENPSPTATAAGAAQRRLHASTYTSLRGVRCETQDGAVVLRGRVASFYLKQLAQEAVRHADAACSIVNELEVAACRISHTAQRGNPDRVG